MAVEYKAKPTIDPRHFSKLFEQKRYYIVDLTNVIAAGQITRDDLETANRFDNKISHTIVKSLRRHEPIYLRHAVAFVSVINELLGERGHSKLRLEPNDAIEGAFFVIRGLELLMSERSLTTERLAEQTDYPPGLVEDARAGKRVTLTTALDLLRAINAVPNAAFVDPSTVVTSDPKTGKSAAAKGCRAQRNKYEKWPPDTLHGTDQDNITRLSVVTSLPTSRRST